jgi:hypothetical protein
LPPTFHLQEGRDGLFSRHGVQIHQRSMIIHGNGAKEPR